MSSPDTTTFRVTRWREGYTMSDVDDFLADVRPWLTGRLPNPDVAERIRNARFNPVRLRPGYDIGEVDEHLGHLESLALHGHPLA